MRATVHKVLQSQVDSNGVQILNANLDHSDDNQTYTLNDDFKNADGQDLQMTIAKRHAVVLMLTLRNEKYNDLRKKNRVFNRWRKASKEAQTFTLQLEIARLAKEVETIKFHQEVVRTDFTIQKTELESKVNILLGLIAQ